MSRKMTFRDKNTIKIDIIFTTRNQSQLFLSTKGQNSTQKDAHVDAMSKGKETDYVF